MAFPEKQTQRFCDQCGRSLIPLNVPHVQRKCQDCGKTIHVAEPGEGGTGESRLKKETPLLFRRAAFVSHWTPQATGQFSRPGIAWFMKEVYFRGRANTPDEVTSMLAGYTKEAENILENNKTIKNLDLNDKNDAAKAYELVKDKQDLAEWWAMLVHATSSMVREALVENDTPRAVWAMTTLSLCRNMHIFKEYLEETVWRGYLANQVVYNAASAAAHTPGEAEAIKKLEPLFSRLEENVLHAWVNSGQPIGPRIGVTALPEKMLKALAGLHLSVFQRKREEDRWNQENRIKLRQTRYQGIGLGVAIISGVAGVVWIIVQILKAYGKI